MSTTPRHRYVLIANRSSYATQILETLVKSQCSPTVLLLSTRPEPQSQHQGGVRSVKTNPPTASYRSAPPEKPHGASSPNANTMPVLNRSKIEHVALRNRIDTIIDPSPDESLLRDLASKEIELGVIACFGRRLDLPMRTALPIGFINLHPSLLPEYRGPTPLSWQRHRHERFTGVTLHWLDEGIDSGPVIAQSRQRLDLTLTSASLEVQLATRAAYLLCALLQQPADLPEGIAQDESRASHFPMFHGQAIE